MLSLKENASVTGLAVLLALVIAPAPLALLLSTSSVLAQTPSPDVTFPMPESEPNGMTVHIGGSNSMVFINQALAQRFENQFPETQIVSNYNGAEAALQALLDDEIDLAAIGRVLTEAEKAQGLVEVLITRHKIAMIVGVDNPFKGDLTIRQFAQIFRGEITNWSEVGGPSRPIRKIDRPQSSDTRQAFQNYLIFQEAAFETGTNAVILSEDSTDLVTRSLGSDGISYAIVEQVSNNPDVRIVPMHEVLPDDSRYPFSQPLSYVYKGPAPNPAAEAFLGYATDTSNDTAIEAARVKGAVAATTGEILPSSAESAAEIATSAKATTAEGVISPQGSAASEADSSLEETLAHSPTAAQNGAAVSENWFSPGGWLFIILALGIPLILLLSRESQSSAEAVPVAKTRKNRLILVPRTSQDAFAFWEVSEADKADLRQQGGRRYMLRLYDVTGIDPALQTPHNMKQFECDERTPYKHLPIEVSDREYMAELGYLTSQGHWLKIASSDKVRVLPGQPETSEGKPVTAIAANALAAKDNAITAETPATADAAAAKAASPQASLEVLDTPAADDSTIGDINCTQSVGESRIILTSRTPKDAYAYWEVPEAVKAAQRQAEGQRWALRIYDVTDIDIDHQPPHQTQEYPCSEQTQDMHVAIPMGGRDYLADLGCVTDDNQWLSVIRSFHVRVPADG